MSSQAKSGLRNLRSTPPPGNNTLVEWENEENRHTASMFCAASCITCLGYFTRFTQGAETNMYENSVLPLKFRQETKTLKQNKDGISHINKHWNKVSVKGEITFLARGLHHKCSSIPYNNLFPGERKWEPADSLMVLFPILLRSKMENKVVSLTQTSLAFLRSMF